MQRFNKIIKLESLINRELKIETFSGRRQLQPDVTSSFVGYCACSCSPPCRRGPVGDVKMVCLALWRKREYLTFISGLLRWATNILQIIVLKLSLFSLRHISSSISKLCYLNLHLWMFLSLICDMWLNKTTYLLTSMFSCHWVKIQLGKQPTVTELDMDKIFLRAK